MKLQWHGSFRAILATLILSGMAAAPTFASDTDAPPFDVKVTLITPSTICLGEPILLKYKIANVSQRNVTTHPGIYGTEWYKLTLRDAQGVSIPPILDRRPAHPLGAYSGFGGLFLRVKPETMDDYIPVTLRFAIQRPGKYVLTLHANLPYAYDGITDDTYDTDETEAMAMASGLHQMQDITFPILITPADPIRLRHTAEVLSKAYREEDDSQLGRAKLDCLFSMPEAQAAASWRALAFQPKTIVDNVNVELVGSKLAELRSATGTDILAEMLDKPEVATESIRVDLNRLYNGADPALREHIKANARKRGYEMPPVAGTPIILD